MAILAILTSSPNGFVSWFGTVCSSWSICSRGTTLRSWLAPLGNCDLMSVLVANAMVGRQGLKPYDNMISKLFNITPKKYGPINSFLENLSNSSLAPGRCCLLKAVTMCLRGVWILEQPRQSLMIRHPGMRNLIRRRRASRNQFHLFILILTS